MKGFEREIPGLVDLHDRVAVRPNIKAYLASDRRIAFNEDGIFGGTRRWMGDRRHSGMRAKRQTRNRLRRELQSGSMLRIAPE